MNKVFLFKLFGYIPGIVIKSLPVQSHLILIFNLILWFQIGKRVHQGCILSPCLSNLYAQCIMRNAGLDETQAGIKIAGRNINNLR